MDRENIEITKFPIRLSKDLDKYILFNTKAYKTIYLDEHSYKVYQFIASKKNVKLSEIEETILLNKDPNTNINVHEDACKFIKFLEDYGFVV